MSGAELAAKTAWSRRVRRVGGFIQVAFAAFWLVRGSLNIDGGIGLALAAVFTAVVAVVIVYGVRTSSGVAPRPVSPEAKHIERAVTIATIVQLAASFAAPAIVIAAGHSDWLLPSIAVTIGPLLLWLDHRVEIPRYRPAGWALIVGPLLLIAIMSGAALAAITGIASGAILLAIAAAGFHDLGQARAGRVPAASCRLAPSDDRTFVVTVRHEPSPQVERIPSGSFYRGFLATVAAAELAPTRRDPSPVNRADLADLPDTVQRYLHFMGVVGRPRDWSFQARFTGRFRREPDKSWMPCQAWQYNTASPIARVFHMSARFLHLVPMTARDTYIGGHGRMLGKIFDRFTVVDGSGDEFDIGELSTFLNDAVLLAPSMLLSANTTWSDVDDGAFDVTLTDGPRTVTGRVSIDNRGAPLDFTTTDRYAALSTGLEQAKWSTPIEAWTVSRGRPTPTRASAIWHLPAGPFTYIDGSFLTGSIRYNIGPSGTTSDTDLEPTRVRDDS